MTKSQGSHSREKPTVDGQLARSKQGDDEHVASPGDLDMQDSSDDVEPIGKKAEELRAALNKVRQPSEQRHEEEQEAESSSAAAKPERPRGPTEAVADR